MACRRTTILSREEVSSSLPAIGIWESTGAWTLPSSARTHTISSLATAGVGVGKRCYKEKKQQQVALADVGKSVLRRLLRSSARRWEERRGSSWRSIWLCQRTWTACARRSPWRPKADAYSADAPAAVVAFAGLMSDELDPHCCSHRRHSHCCRISYCCSFRCRSFRVAKERQQRQLHAHAC